ncbi:MAG TPA: Rrf2 family transcriptional regulator [Edaphocola sp.]|nr:Rrf2 family transcriptional regulator [Edaphocola sp.]
MLSQTSKTAIKAVIYLSGKSKLKEKAGIKEVSEKINASEHTVGKILQNLARHGYLNSTKGPNGGFFMDEQQQQQAIYDIVVAIEGDGIFTECGLGLKKCSSEHPCPIHNDYKVVKDLMVKTFKEKRIKDLLDPVTHGLAYLIG